jgi:hypothetical protein
MISKEFPTFTAFIRSFSSVNTLVLKECGTFTKGLATFTALIRPFSSVNSSMFNEVGLVAK